MGDIIKTIPSLVVIFTLLCTLVVSLLPLLPYKCRLWVRSYRNNGSKSSPSKDTVHSFHRFSCKRHASVACLRTFVNLVAWVFLVAPKSMKFQKVSLVLFRVWSSQKDTMAICWTDVHTNTYITVLYAFSLFWTLYAGRRQIDVEACCERTTLYFPRCRIRGAWL